jgi:hypothetical protein
VTLVAAACNPVNPYAALVNGSTISQHDVSIELNSIGNDPSYLQALTQNGAGAVRGSGAGTFSSAFVSQVLTRQIQYSVIHQEVLRRHLAVGAEAIAAQAPSVAASTPGYQKLPKAYQQVLLQRSADAAALEAAVSGIAAGPAGAQLYIQSHAEQFVTACAQHILVKTQAEALQVEGALAGGSTFAAVAKAVSIDTGSAAQGGSLGCQSANAYVAPFAHAVETLPLNTVSQPVQSQFGWHVIEVSSRTAEPAAQAAQDVQQLTINSINGVLRQDFAKAAVVVDSHYGGWSPTQGVTPPKAPHPASDFKA